MRLLTNSLLLDAFSGNNQKRAPVWLMRQAGRYMPSYQALRKEHSLTTLFHTPKFIQEVTLLPIDELGVDAAIIFSDILLLFEAMGCIVHYPEKGSPWIEARGDLANLQKEGLNLPKAIQELEKLNYLFEGIALTKKQLNTPLFGFCAAPFTLLSYLLDREDRVAFPNTFHLAKTNPFLFKTLLEQFCALSIQYAKLQIKAGCDLFQIFESSGHVLTQEECLTYSIPYLEKIVQALDVPCIAFMKGSCKNLEALKSSSLPSLSFDWDLPMNEIRSKVGTTKVLQGNLDPRILLESEAQVEKETLALLESMQGDPKFILNLGHGILPTTPYKNVVKFVNIARCF